MSVIILFIDGVGLGAEADYNPWATESTPNLNRLLAGRNLVADAVGRASEKSLLLAADATLGVPGLPQSATGQATIFTGRNAPQAMNHHQSGLPFRRLREWVEQENLYLHAQRKGYTITFANSYTPEFFDLPTTRRGWVSVSTCAIRSTGQPLRTLDDLLAGRAVYHDLTRRFLARKRGDIDEISPETAADHLLGLACEHDLVVHEFFLSDLAGHKQNREEMSWVTRHYDVFIGSVVNQLRQHDLLLLVSDHGNSEDLRVKTHTMNNVPLLAVTSDIAFLDEMEKARELWDLTHITPVALQWLENHN
ncbi:alkaline phosphatase family protein [Desmospora activa]|uniref:Phosphoglycerate mutase n=1 Tax=Desmospora activa DSM 45169 TaxID=1121389 RepID=A0A2T4Z3S1_9BACL|nr:alkaline phosphatase family protein [Desmospora activa]PTM56527.1 phosphoglycerate mutase [Desmospora activa DSM 45169]